MDDPPAPQQAQVRQASTGDREALVRLAVSNAMFTAEEFEGVLVTFDAFLADPGGDDRWVVATRGDAVTGAAYVAPEPFSDRLWNLYFLAADPSAHGTGVGTALVRDVEDALRRAGQERARVLLVETSSTDAYAGARAFYAARGFEREATIRQYYGPDDHKVVFWKQL